MIATRIITSDRNRPAELREASDPELQKTAAARREMFQKTFLERGMPPEKVGDIVLEAILEGRFYILTHPQIKERVKVRMQDILEDRNPSPLPRESGDGGRG